MRMRAGLRLGYGWATAGLRLGATCRLQAATPHPISLEASRPPVVLRPP